MIDGNLLYAICGMIAGFTCVAIGSPLDIIRSRKLAVIQS